MTGPQEFSVPHDQRYFEDYLPGAVYEFGAATLSEADIIAFAKLYDPQPMHVDSQFAAQGQFGGLIASGWQTVGLMTRMMVDHFMSSVAGLASPGVDELRWFRPVRPGDRLHVRASVLESKRSRSKPDRGVVLTLVQAINQDGEVAASYVVMYMLRARGLA